MLGLDLFRPIVRILVAVVPENYICARLGIGVCDSQTNTTYSAGSYRRPSLPRCKVENLGAFAETRTVSTLVFCGMLSEKVFWQEGFDTYQ